VRVVPQGLPHPVDHRPAGRLRRDPGRRLTASDGSLTADRLAEVVVHPGLEPAFAILREGAGGEGDDQLVGCRASPSRSAFATS
jgi:hypothetical protein